MIAFVLDNSVAMHWCFDTGAHAYADGVLDMLESGEGQAFVPILWCYEASAVLARAQNNGLLDPQRVAELLENLQALNIVVDAGATDRILANVYQLAVTYCLTSYDAAYLELALRRGLPLTTLNQDLLLACKTAGVAVL